MDSLCECLLGHECTCCFVVCFAVQRDSFALCAVCPPGLRVVLAPPACAQGFEHLVPLAESIYTVLSEGIVRMRVLNASVVVRKRVRWSLGHAWHARLGDCHCRQSQHPAFAVPGVHGGDRDRRGGTRVLTAGAHRHVHAVQPNGVCQLHP